MGRIGGERARGGFDGNTYSCLKFSNKFVSFQLKRIKLSCGPPLHRSALRQQSVPCLCQSGRLMVDPESPPHRLWSHRRYQGGGIQGCQQFLLKPLAVQLCITRCQCGLSQPPRFHLCMQKTETLRTFPEPRADFGTIISPTILSVSRVSVFSIFKNTNRHSELRVALLSTTTFSSQCLSLGRQPARTPQGRQWKVPFRVLKAVL